MNIFDAPDFRNLPTAVQSLFAAAGEESYFNLAEWYDVAARCGQTPGSNVRLYVDDACRAGLVTCRLVIRPDNLMLCTTPYTCESGALYATRNDTGSVRTLVAAVVREAHVATVLWTGFDPVSPAFAATLSGLRDARFLARAYCCWGNWYENVGGSGFDAYLERRPSILRNTWQRKMKALEKDAQPTFRINGELEQFISYYNDVYRRSWKTAEPFPNFMPALMRTAAALGALRTGVLMCGDQPIAAQFWLVWRRRATIFKLAYDEKWERYSPGTLLTMEMARAVLSDDKPSEIDFGRGDDGYKKLWLSQRRERWGIEAANPNTLRGAMAGAAIAARMARERLRRWNGADPFP
jgi:hypothetical protein